MNSTKILLEAIEVFGRQSQILKLSEEISELQSEILKDTFKITDREDVISEVADVGICLDQLFLILDMDIPNKNEILGIHDTFKTQYAEIALMAKTFLKVKDYSEEAACFVYASIHFQIKLLKWNSDSVYAAVGFYWYCYQMLLEQYQDLEVFTARKEKLLRLEAIIEANKLGSEQ